MSDKKNKNNVNVVDLVIPKDQQGLGFVDKEFLLLFQQNQWRKKAAQEMRALAREVRTEERYSEILQKKIDVLEYEKAQEREKNGIWEARFYKFEQEEAKRKKRARARGQGPH